ncbi:MAG: hypothetical protein HY906_10700 [Deltaproteobacteria bacterium]|nr:hypothetical protein [Deltaproteobacteria bacterium]
MNHRPAVESEETRNVTDPAVDVAAVRIEFRTGDVRAAGTDAEVFLRIGNRTFPMPAEHGKDPFERGAKDAFVFVLDPPMKLADFRKSEIEVYHNSEGSNPGWFVAAIRLWVSLSSQPAQGFLYKEWTDIGWLAIDEAPFATQVTLQQAG